MTEMKPAEQRSVDSSAMPQDLAKVY